jgi:hypothetical protein
MSEVGRSEDWEDQILQQLAQMFKGFGVNIEVDALRNMMEQIRDQFEDLGIDPDEMAKGYMKVELSANMDVLGKLLSGGNLDLSNLISNLGFGVEVEAPQVNPPEVDEKQDTVIQVPAADVYLQGDVMSVTVDCSKAEGLISDELDLELQTDGKMLHLNRSIQDDPIQRILLPHRVLKVQHWELNNGILDLAFLLAEEPRDSAGGASIPIE